MFNQPMVDISSTTTDSYTTEIIRQVQRLIGDALSMDVQNVVLVWWEQSMVSP